jgi:cytochrome c5
MEIWKKILLATILVTLAMAPLAIGDYAYTACTFTVASSISFSVTVKGDGSPTTSIGTYPGNPTTAIYFNSTTSTQSAINPCANPDFATNCQDADNPILNFTNTGTATFNMTMRFSTALSSGISVSANSTCNGGSCAGLSGAPASLDNTNWKRVCQGLETSAGNWCGVWLYANFSNVAAGAYTHDLVHNSTLDQGT